MGEYFKDTVAMVNVCPWSGLVRNNGNDVFWLPFSNLRSRYSYPAIAKYSNTIVIGGDTGSVTFLYCPPQ
jgi:hypothetical protein